MSEYHKYPLRSLILNQGEDSRIIYPLLYVFYLVSGNGLLPGPELSGTGDPRPGIGYWVSGSPGV